MTTLRWIKSSGGPLLVIDEALAPLWRGILGCSFVQAGSSGGETDYDRACGIRDYTGVVDVADGIAIVLGDMPLATTAWVNETGSTLIIRAFYMDPDEDVIEDIGSIIWANEIESINAKFPTGKLMIFDSSRNGQNLNSDFISISVGAGVFRISTYELKPHSRAAFLIHKFDQAQ